MELIQHHTKFNTDKDYDINKSDVDKDYDIDRLNMDDKSEVDEVYDKNYDNDPGLSFNSDAFSVVINEPFATSPTLGVQHDSLDRDVEKGSNDPSQHHPSAIIDVSVPATDIQSTVTDWNGPDDPENPNNWPMWKRVFHTAVTGSLAFAVTFGSSVYTPGYPEVKTEFHVSTTAALLPLSLYVVSIGLGPVIAAPLSETYGRLLIYRISIPLSMLFTLGAGFSQTFAQLCICRFFAALLGSPVMAVGSGTNTDIWPAHVRAPASAMFILAPFLGPALGPFIGGFSAMNKGWRWTQWDILFITLACYICSLGMSETYKKIILQRRAKRLGISLPATGPRGLAALKFLLFVTLLRPIHMLLTEPIVAFFSIYVAFAFSVLFAFFAAFPIVFQGVYGFNTGESGTTFLAVGLGIIIGVVTSVLIDRYVYMKEYRKALAQGKIQAAPEHRLYSAMIGSFGLPLGIFVFGWTARSDIHWIVPVLASIPFAWGNLSIFISAVLYLSDVYGSLVAASAIAANGLLRYVLGGAFPLFTVQMYHSLGVAWATSLFGFISIAMLPIPWVLFKWGPQIRAKSQYDTTKA